MNNLFYWVIGILVLIGGVWYFTNSNSVSINTQDPVATTTDSNATSTNELATTTSTSTTGTGTSAGTNTGTKPRVIPGYPSSWPTDVPRYPVESVKYTGGNNPQSGPIEATVVFGTPDSARTVTNFYLDGLRANGWKITEDGGGNANMITIRATKARRTVGVYSVRETNGKTTVTVGVNIGI